MLSCSTKEKTPYESDLDFYSKQELKTKRSDEVRALWIVRLEMKSKSDIDKSISKMLEYNLNTAIVQVRGLADVLYPSKIEPIADDIEESLADPFQYFIEQAKLHNIKVQAWLNVNMLSKPKFLQEFSKAEKHLVKKNPEWVLVDEEGRSMLDYQQDELEADWMDGAYANPLNSKWKSYFLTLVKEIQKKYEIQGIHLDFIRYPNAKHGKRIFGLDELHLTETQKIIPLSKEELLENPHYLQALDVVKLQAMNQFVKEIYEEVKRNNANHLLTAAVWAHKEKTLKDVYQDWPLWLKKNYLDQAYMMIYVKDNKYHDLRMNEFYNPVYNDRLVVGLGLYRFPSAKVIQNQIRSSRAVGAAGFCFFSGKMLIYPELEKKINKESILEVINEAQSLDQGMSPPQKL